MQKERKKQKKHTRSALKEPTLATIKHGRRCLNFLPEISSFWRHHAWKTVSLGQRFNTYRCWNTVSGCGDWLGRLLAQFQHRPLHLPIWKSGHEHALWTWCDTYCRNVNMVRGLRHVAVICRYVSWQHFYSVPRAVVSVLFKQDEVPRTQMSKWCLPGETEHFLTSVVRMHSMNTAIQAR